MPCSSSQGAKAGSSHEDPPPDTDLARIFASLVMLRQLSTSAAFGRVGRASPEQARSEAGQDAGHQRAPEPLVSIREGAWRFADPVFDDAKIGTADKAALSCWMQPPAAFEFQVLRRNGCAAGAPA